MQLEQAEEQLARDQALLADARVDLERYETLVRQNSIPKQQLDTQRSLVRQDEAALQSDQAQVDQARLQLVTALGGGWSAERLPSADALTADDDA